MGCVDILGLDLIIGDKSQFTAASAAPIMTTVLWICLSWVKYMEVIVLWMVGRDLGVVCRHKAMRRESDGLEGLSQGGRVMKVQWAPWVIKRHGGEQRTGVDHVYTVWRLWNHTYWNSATPTHTLLEKHSTGLAGYVCLSFCMFACVCMCGPHEW